MARIGTCRLNREGVSVIQTSYRKGRWANIDAFCHAYSIPRSTYYELIARDRWFEQATIQDKLTALGIPADDHARLCEFRDESFDVPPPATPLSSPSNNHFDNRFDNHFNSHFNSHFNNYSNSYPNNLPLQPTSFIGRENEKATVKSLLAANSLITLTGTGGCGKTRLALQTATELLPEYPDGVWLVELAALASPDLVPQALLAALGLREEPAHSSLDTVTNYLRPRSLLLVIDNCEHLLLACAQLATSILRTCPNIRILATSREALAIAGETVWRVPSLVQPDNISLAPGNLDETELVALLASYDAIRLFVERAHAVRTDFALTGRNAVQIMETCRRLDGMPLAIELAAARTKSLSIQEINRHLDHRFQLLTGGSRTALPRQQTLQALMDWSYDLLTAPEKLFLHRLSVFAGSWTLEAAEEICRGEGVGALDLLTSLADKSLVVAEVRDRGTRYRLLETVRHYALERLRQSAECEVVMRCHQDYYLSFAEMAEPELSGADQGPWLQRVEEEHDNLRAGLDRALQIGGASDGSDGSEVALRYCAAMGHFWLLRGHLTEGWEWCVRTLRMGTDTGIIKEGNGIGFVPEADTIRSIRAKVLHAAGRLASLQGNYSSASACFNESLVISQEMGHPDARAAALRGLGLLAWQRSDYTSASTCYSESMTLSRASANLDGIADALAGLGHVAHYQGDTIAAWKYYQESLAVRREIGNPGGIASALNNLGGIAESQGDYIAARIYHEESLSVRRDIGERNGIASSLANLGLAALWQGDYPVARANIEESLAIYRQIGNRHGVAFNLNSLGNLAYAQGNDTSARLYYQESLAIRREIGNRRGIANALNGLGNTAWRQGNPAEARAYFEESLAIGREIGERYDITVSLAGLGDVAILEGLYAEARTCYQESLSIAHTMRYRKAIALALEALAALAARENPTALESRNVSETPAWQAALLWSAAETLRATIHSPIPQRDRETHSRAVTELRNTLGEEIFKQAWAIGHSMSLEQAISLALQDR